MPTPDTIQGIDLPTYDDPPGVPDDLSLIWYAMISRGVPRFSNGAQRDAAYPSPTAGQLCAVAGALQLFNGTAWTRIQNPLPRQSGQFFIAQVSNATTNAAGDASITINGGGFGTSLGAVWFQDTHTSMSLGAMTFRWNASASSASTVAYRVFGTSGPLANFAHRVSLLMVGE
ncbi:hypothetical protein JN535_04295 [Cellulosimicrobium cellulans]|uniref:hypothetical protein n=1 Tax=Cellulosimicrobium cellulans TaxID=1710 RepID=UPI001964A1FF|nr:hypothetical protein [Cellulosimicrobium cellulans]MBN0039395.1 hypothetical protein [Cellulosimicrobium cellulans]